jgi:hypothetical protein
MEFWAALVGAIVGGMATFAASAWQTRRILNHERQMARDARETEAADRRRERGADAATQMIDALARFVSWKPHDIGHGMTNDRWTAFDRDLEAMRVLEGSRAPMIDAVCRNRWTSLVKLVEEFRARPVSEAEMTEDTGHWTREVKIQAAYDILRYGRYTRDSLIAFLDGTAVPDEITPPVLRRPKGTLWNWDPERRNRDW